MEYSKLVAVTGLPGLYELINSKTDGAIIKSLDDNSTKFASSRIHSFSHLESIEVYTVTDNVNLVEIFHAMEKGNGSTPDSKDNDAVKKYFEKVYPDLDFERVYPSDLKKMVKWFEVLKKNNIEIKLSEPVEEEAEEAAIEEERPKEKTKKEAKTAPSQPAKKETVKEDKSKKKETKAKAEEKPAKKAATKKKEEEKKPAKKSAPKKKK